MENVIVTGGAGFIGSNLCRILTDQVEELIVIDKLTYAGDSSRLDDIEGKLLVQDINEPIIDILDEYGIDTVFHLAAETHVDNSIRNPDEFVKTNVNGTLNLICDVVNYNPKIRFVNISTDEVFGDLDYLDDPFTEESPYKPSSPYSASKAGADFLVKSYVRTFGLNAITTNCSNNYGPNQHEEKLIPKVIQNISNGEPIPVYGSGENIRDWIYVDDHCEALIHLAKNGKEGESYNIGADEEWCNLSIIHEIAGIMGKNPEIEFVEDRKGHDFRYAINSAKVKETGWEPKMDFREGLEKTIEFYK